MPNCTRVIEFDAAHRVMEHESKCRNLHGHRYKIELTVAGELDSLGRVIDFGVMKSVFGGWVDQNLDHGCILFDADEDVAKLCEENGWRFFLMDSNPTAENLAELLFEKAKELLPDLTVVRLRLYETPNCWSEVSF